MYECETVELFPIESQSVSRYFSSGTEMAEITRVSEHPFSETDGTTATPRLERAGRSVKNAVAKSVFWAFERGSWQYDIIVILILSFIFLSPRAWFNDRPTLQLSDLRHAQGVVEVGKGKDGWRYIIDARLVDSYSPQPTERTVQTILQRRLQKPFTVKSIDQIRDRNNVVLGYTVVVTEP